MIANTIDEVIEKLDLIIQASKKDKSPLGYFAALYQNVTITVKEKLNTGYFENDIRMEKLDVVFANRYLEAYENYQQNKETTASWEVTFNAASNNSLIVLQHLLLGMNAHINLDLGIAAAQVTDPSNIQSLQSDFNKINELLASLVEKVQNDLAQIWPTLLVILKFINKADSFFVNFGMNIARDGAWNFANEISPIADSNQLDEMIKVRDKKIAKTASIITDHGLFLRIIFKIIRIGERGTVSDRISALEKVKGE